MPAIQPASSSRTISNPLGAAVASKRSDAFDRHVILPQPRRLRLGTGGPDRRQRRRSAALLGRAHILFPPLLGGLLQIRSLPATPAAGRESRRAYVARSRAARHASGSRRRATCRCRCRRPRQPRDAAAPPIRASPAPSGHARSAPRRWRATAPRHNRAGRPQPRLRWRSIGPHAGAEYLDRERRRRATVQPQHAHIRLGPRRLFVGGAVHGEPKIRWRRHSSPRADNALRKVAKVSRGPSPAAIAAAASVSATSWPSSSPAATSRATL